MHSVLDSYKWKKQVKKLLSRNYSQKWNIFPFSHMKMTRQSQPSPIFYGKMLKMNHALGMNAQTKQGIAFVFASAVEGISDSIHKYTAYKVKSKSLDPIM